MLRDAGATQTPCLDAFLPNFDSFQRATDFIITDEDTLEVSTRRVVQSSRRLDESSSLTPLVEQEQLDDDDKNTYCQDSIDRIEGEEKPLERHQEARECHSLLQANSWVKLMAWTQ